MITTKQRAYLRSLATTTDALYQIGKNGVTDTVIATLSDALDKRELIKITVQETAPETGRELMTALIWRLGCEPVQVIGRKIVIYRQAPKQEDRKIVLPK